MPLSRICEVHDVSRKQIYTKIDFLHRQAVAFSTAREVRIRECLADRSAWLATDIQVILVNWPVKNRRGTIPLLHMATVHKFSQFVVAATVDLDESATPEALEEAMEQCGDFALPRSMRRHARLWAHSEYQDSLLRSQSGLLSKDDLAIAGKLRLPGRGCRVRGDAFKFAHMMMVKKLVGQQFKRLHYCLDDEAGLAAAVAALNVDLIRSGRVNVAEISFIKGMTNDSRLQFAVEGRQVLESVLTMQAARIEAIRREFPHLSDFQAATLVMLRHQYGDLSPRERAEKLAKEGMPWPFHTKAEPMKTIRLKTDREDRGWDELARFFAGASIHPVDAYFNFARRRVAGFERGLPTASNDRRIWHAYSYYDPGMVPKMVEILRFYYNYMLALPDSGGQTPAMRLGLAKGKVYPRDLLAWTS